MTYSHEAGPEQIPTKEEVVGVIENIIGKISSGEGSAETKERAVTIERYDEQGLYVLELTVSEKESIEEKQEYTYVRAGAYPDGYQRLTTGIDIVYYDESGIPCAGPMSNVAEFVNGQWVEVEG